MKENKLGKCDKRGNKFILLFMTIHEYPWLFITIQDYSWLFRTIHNSY